MNLSKHCIARWMSWLLAFSAPMAYGGFCCSLWMTALGKDLMGWLQPAWGAELNCIQLFADALLHSMWTRWFWASWWCVSWALPQASPPKLTTPRAGQIFHQSQQRWEPLGAQHRQVSGARDLLLQQASLQRAQRQPHTLNLTPNCRMQRLAVRALGQPGSHCLAGSLSLSLLSLNSPRGIA